MSSFGEIVEPGSRAVFEDWDDYTDRNAVELKWRQNFECPDEIDMFLVLEGKYLNDCTKAQASKLEKVDSIPEVSLHLYRSRNTSKYICALLDYDLVLSSQIVELLKKYLKVSKNVFTIQTRPLAEHQAIFPTTTCIIRAVTTSQSQGGFKTFPRLEQPNMVSGVAAGVISYREHSDASGAAYIAFLENTEEYNIKEMEQLLDQLEITKSKTATSSVLNSNLYM